MDREEAPSAAPAPQRARWPWSRILVPAGGLLAVAVIIGVVVFGGLPGSRERVAERAELAYRQQIQEFSGYCRRVTSVVSGEARYACRLLVRARPSGNWVFEITEIRRGAGTVAVWGRWDPFSPPVSVSRLAFFANPREYDQPGAFARPGDGENYENLSEIFLAQVGEPEARR